MAYVRNDLDHRVYVWTKQAGRSTSGKAVISAHGTEAIINGGFPPGNYELIYYVPHGCQLIDPGINSVLTKKYFAVETLTAQTAYQDYDLTKYQNRHSNYKETYTQIENLPDDCDMDIITVRKDKSLMSAVIGEGIYLSYLIKLVHQKGYNYTKFFCAFCRGGSVAGLILGDDAADAFEVRPITDGV